MKRIAIKLSDGSPKERFIIDGESYTTLRSKGVVKEQKVSFLLSYYQLFFVLSFQYSL